MTKKPITKSTKTSKNCCEHEGQSVINKNKIALFIFIVLLMAATFIAGNIVTAKQLKVSLSPPAIFASDDISVSELSKSLENKNFTFINVHTPYEGEIKGTDMFIEYDSIVANKQSLPKDKNTPIVIYCKSGNMSTKALNTMKGLGYKNVKQLTGGFESWQEAGKQVLNLALIPDKVTPSSGFELSFSLGDLGPELINIGAIDLSKFEKATNLTPEQKEILTKGSNDNLTINSSNTHFMVNTLWALGLAQKSLIYNIGPMGTEYKDKAANFASTGGWSLAKSDAMNYLNKFDLIPLTASQHQIVYDIAQNVFRPCCGNATSFPDCNHGMAALAAIEIMVSQGLPEQEIYKNILKLNSFWFPSTYLTIATYFERQGISWEEIDAKLVLGQSYSSGQGAADLIKKVGTLPYEVKGGGSCGA